MSDTWLWSLKLYARKALYYLIRKHPRAMSIVSLVLIRVGRFASHPVIAAIIGVTILPPRVVQAAGAMTVTVGEWLGAAVDSAAAEGEAQAQPRGQAAQLEDDDAVEC